MNLKLLSAATALAAVTAVSAHAATVDLSSFVNANVSAYYNGGVYPANGGSQTIGGVNFNLAQFPGGGTGVVQAAGGDPDSFLIPVGQIGVTTVYTVANSAFGLASNTIGSLVFTGSAGATFTYELTEGDNIRDHATTAFNDSAPNIFATKDYGDGDHLDVQKIVLPTAFATQTLTSITFNAVDQGTGNPFLAAITTAGGVPEPGAWALSVLGMGLLGGAMRSARRKEAAATA
jgi:hypothetical protein